MAAISYGTTTLGGTPAPFPKTRWTLACQARDHGVRLLQVGADRGQAGIACRRVVVQFALAAL